MTEAWAIAIVGMAMSAIAIALKYLSDQIVKIGDKLDKINESLRGYVDRDDCDDDMDKHCKRIERLEATVLSHTQQLNVITKGDKE